MARRLRLALALLCVALGAPGFAQGTNGTLDGRTADEQGLALAGVTITAKDTATGFSRSTVTDVAGVFRLPGLPVGQYEVSASLSGFASRLQKNVVVNVSSTTHVAFKMTVAGQSEELTVVAEAPLIDTRETGVGEVITSQQIASLPLNGRQFANLAGLVPGVSLGFHTDPTKSTQFAPQVAGGGGRNINYLIDGGDNNDDTVGGLVQNFPLDSIGEFNFQTQRFRADTGRANGGTLKVVTKSGTNELKGSAFEFFRDKSLNALSRTEEINNRPKGDYRRHQYGASLGGPIIKDKTHFFAAFERVQQDTTQAVSTKGLFPEKDGVFPTPFRENLFVGKLTHQVNTDNYLSVRYGYNNNEQPYGASPSSPPENWGVSKNTFHSVNANLNSTLGGGRLNEFVFQFSYFKNKISENSTIPTETFPNGVTVGQSINTPQSTEQHKFQFRDDFTWTSGRHEWRVGVSFINEPKLDITFSTGQQPQFTHLTSSRTSPITTIQFNGSIGGAGGGSLAKIPNKQYAAYIQDTWRIGDKLTLDLGVRYDLVTGFAFDQSKNIVFAELQAAAQAGVFARTGAPCPCPGFEDFGKEPAEDKNNIAPRAGFTYDAGGDGRFVLRGGAGRYYDFAYTNANILFAVVGAQSSFGQIYSNTNSSGIRNADGTLFQVGQPLPANQLNARIPLPSHAASPRIRQPYTDQANLGFSKSLGGDYALELDAVYAKGSDLGLRPRLNVRTGSATAPRRFAGILPQSGNANFRIDISDGVSHYKGVSVALKKRWDGRLQFLASYTLSKATSNTSLRAVDEFGEYDVLNAYDPFADNQENPVRVDARHRITISGTYAPGWGVQVSPILRYRSKTPFNVIVGRDVNGDGLNWDLPAGVETLNSGRGADFFQLDLRVSKKFSLGKRLRLEALAEVFNLTNDTNPTTFIASQSDPAFGTPTRFAGDFRQTEQRQAQLGLRLEF
jgi:hypothetical protein